MIQFVLSLLGLGNKLTRIQSLSDGALSAFKKTLMKLKATEEKIVAHHAVQDAIISEAAKVKESLDGISATNQKVIAKIEDFLS